MRRLPFRGSAGGLVFDILNYLFMVFFSIIIIIPFWNVIIMSFSSPSDAVSLGFHFWLKKWNFDSYLFVLSDPKVIYGYINAIYRTFFGTILTIILTLMAAYPLSKVELPWRNGITTYFIIPMFFSGGLIPYYLLIKQIGLVDNRLVYIIPGAVTVYYIIIARAYIMGAIDKALEEAAFIDGASYITILFKVIIPLCKPVIATIALWTAVGHWNTWFDSLIFVTTNEKKVLQLVLYYLLKMTAAEDRLKADFEAIQGKQIITSTTRAATIIVTIGPIVLLYPFLQKYFIKGIMIGSLKG